MNLVSAVCPSCGAQIQIPPDQDRAFCSYCGNQIVVKTEIADKVKIDGVVKIQSADFIIEAGALKEYHGAGTDVVIPDNVTNISGAFRKTSITTITLPEELQVLSGAFDSCSSLRAVNLPERLQDISYSFFGCESLKSITLPDGLENLKGSFGYSGLERVTIPSGIGTIGGNDLDDGCFSGCDSLAEVVIEEGVSCIGTNCFSHCSSLEEVIIPASVTKIGNFAFQECKNLSDVTILGSNTKLEMSAFRHCPSLTTVSAPTSVLKNIFRDYGKPEWRPFYDTPWYDTRGKEERKALGICEHCGGNIKGVLVKKCSHCGRKY